MTPDLTYWRLLALVSFGGFALLAGFVAAPEVDLMVAASAFDGTGFGLWGAELAIVRRVYSAVFWTLCLLAGLGLVQRVAFWGEGRTPLRVWLFAAALPAVGTGLLVNVLLKTQWGRARPIDLALFGAEARFSLPFEISGECLSNCSFVSGEGAAAATALVMIIGLFGHRPGWWPTRLMLTALSLAWLSGAAVLRIVPGKHFLSDMLFAFVLIALLGLALYAVLSVGRLRRQSSLSTLGHDLTLAPRFLLRRVARRENRA